MAPREVIATPRRVAVSVLFDVVKVELICGDAYEAQVLYDDMLDRLKAREGLTITVAQGRVRRALTDKE